MFSHEGMEELKLYKKAEGFSKALLITSATGAIAGATIYRNNKDLGLTIVASAIVLNYINLFIRKGARQRIEHETT